MLCSLTHTWVGFTRDTQLMVTRDLIFNSEIFNLSFVQSKDDVTTINAARYKWCMQKFTYNVYVLCVNVIETQGIIA